jgi:hypothetical protein
MRARVLENIAPYFNYGVHTLNLDPPGGFW